MEARSALWVAVTALMLAAEPGRAADLGGLRTDLRRTLIPLDEIIGGGPPPDGIPPIDAPVFVSPAAADGWLRPKEPVLGVRVGSDARAYPLQVLLWHEIVNDVVGGRPLVVTYCPLCNAGLVFDRVVDGTRIDFGTSGRLWKSDLLMYDRQTHSLWSQMEGRAVVGTRAGVRLARVPANTLSYEEFKEAYPAGRDPRLRAQSIRGIRPGGQSPLPVFRCPRPAPTAQGASGWRDSRRRRPRVSVARPGSSRRGAR